MDWPTTKNAPFYDLLNGKEKISFCSFLSNVPWIHVCGPKSLVAMHDLPII
jgi:hypothetical protein